MSRWTMPAACAVSSAGAGLAQPAQRRGRAGSARPRLQHVGDGAAAHELHDHEGAPVVLADVVDRHHVRVRGEPGGGARLALEAAARASSSARWAASTFTATARSSSSSCASQTPAIPPLAMWRTTR